jgi:hypothetical protein
VIVVLGGSLPLAEPEQVDSNRHVKLCLGPPIMRHYQGLWCTISPRPLSEGGGVYATL